MSCFTERVRKLRKERGLSQAELANILGVGKTTISNYETEYSAPDIKMLERIADLFGVTVDYIMGRSETLTREAMGAKEVFVVGTVRAGNPCFAMQEVIGSVFLPKNMIAGNHYFGLKVTGDSMNLARICDGDVVIVRQQSYAENGDIVVALVGEDEATVKRYFQSGQMVTLLPDSSNKNYAPIQVDTAVMPLTIMGVVVQTIITFK